MLIALFTLLLLGSTPSSLLDYLDDLHNDVKAIVVDDARRKAVVAALSASRASGAAEGRQTPK